VISPETIAAVKERVDIVALIGENVRLVRAGRGFKGLCPFHREKTPSFHVNPERGFFHCFGCGESGSVVDYVMKLEGLTFIEAMRVLAERAGVTLEEVHGARLDAASRRAREKEELYALSNMVAGFLERQILPGGHPLASIARAELQRRGLAPGDSSDVDSALSAFRVGYAPYGWEGLAAFLRQQGTSFDEAERLGLVVRRHSGSGHYDAFRHRLMFAVVDKAGRVVAFSGRALAEPTPAELAGAGIQPMSRPAEGERPDPPKYINSPESPIYVKGETVFGLYQARLFIREEQRAVVVEGNFDVLALHARGVRHVVAPLGTAFTAAQARLVKRYAPEMVVMFDGDAAGKKAAMAARMAAREAGLNVRVASMPAGMDPDELARTRGAEAIQALVRGSRGMLEYLIDETLGSNAVWDGTRQQTLTRIRQVLVYLAEESDPNLRAMAKTYADEVASKLVVGGRAPSDLRALERMVEKALGSVAAASERRGGPVGPDGAEPRRSGHEGAAGLVPEPGRGAPDTIVWAVLGALLDFPALSGEPEVETALGLLEGEAALGAGAVAAWHAKKSGSAAELLDLLPQAIHAFAVGRLAAPRFSELAEARAELLNNAEKLRLRSLKGDKAVKGRKLARAQGLGDIDAEDELLRQLERLARERKGLGRN
jgi:DNA primase